MKLTFGQQLAQKQTQTMAPQMIQSMEILAMPMAELEDRIDQELIDNIVLEVRDSDPNLPDEAPKETEKEKREVDVEQKEIVVDEAHNNADDFERLLNLQQDVPDHFDGSMPSQNRIQESGDRAHDMMANIAERQDTLQDHLLDQLGLMEVDPPIMILCERIISTRIPEDGGYFKVSLVDLLPSGSTEEELALAEQALETVQQLDPVGIAARDLKECLLLQLTEETPMREEVVKIISEHLEDLGENRIPVIQKATGYSIEKIQEVHQILSRLKPKPASRFVTQYAMAVTPDLWVEVEEDGRYLVKMDEGPTRRLFISNYYRKRLANGQATDEEKEFIKKKVNSAQWLIDAINQRRSTLLRVAQEIVEHQHDFLDKGPEHIVPLKMQQIAEIVKVHVTTISRAVHDKWIETPRGIFALNRFFVGGTQTDQGEDVAWDKIRIKLQEIIDGEDKSKPLSDDELVKRLKSYGFNMARRTVTKYRKKMGILSSRQRRDWSKSKK